MKKRDEKTIMKKAFKIKDIDLRDPQEHYLSLYSNIREKDRVDIIQKSNHIFLCFGPDMFPISVKTQAGWFCVTEKALVCNFFNQIESGLFKYSVIKRLYDAFNELGMIAVDSVSQLTAIQKLVIELDSITLDKIEVKRTEYYECHFYDIFQNLYNLDYILQSKQNERIIERAEKLKRIYEKAYCLS